MYSIEQINRFTTFIYGYHSSGLPHDLYHSNHLYNCLLEAFENGHQNHSDAAAQEISLYALGKLIELARAPAAGVFRDRAALYLTNCQKDVQGNLLREITLKTIAEAGLRSPAAPHSLTAHTSSVFSVKDENTGKTIVMISGDCSDFSPQMLFNHMVNNSVHKDQKLTCLRILKEIFEQAIAPEATAAEREKSLHALMYLQILTNIAHQAFRPAIIKYINRCIQLGQDSQGRAISPEILQTLKQVLGEIILITYPLKYGPSNGAGHECT